MKLKTDLDALAQKVMQKYQIPESNMKKALAIQGYLHKVRVAACETDDKKAFELLGWMMQDGVRFDPGTDSHLRNYELFRCLCEWYVLEQFLSILDRRLEQGLEKGDSRLVQIVIGYFKKDAFLEVFMARIERVFKYAVEHKSVRILDLLYFDMEEKKKKSTQEDPFFLSVFKAKIAIVEKEKNLWDFLYEFREHISHSSREKAVIVIEAIDHICKSMPQEALVEYSLMTPKNEYTQSSNYFDHAHEGPAILSIIELMEREEGK